MKKFFVFLLLLAGAAFAIWSPKTETGAIDPDAFSAMASGNTATPRPTAGPADQTATAQAVKIGDDIRAATIAAENLFAANANGTAVAAASTAEYNRVRATQEVEQATAAQAEYYRRETADVNDANRRSTEQAIESTRIAQAESDARASRAQNATATADAVIFAGHIEQTRAAGLSTGTAVANDAVGTQAAATLAAYSVDKAKERIELTNRAVAVLPFVVYSIVVILTIAGTVLFFPVMKTRLSVIFRDKRGDAPILFDGRGNYADVDRNPYPITTLGKKPSIPAVIPSDLAERTASRDQLIDYQTRGLPSSGVAPRSNGKPPAALSEPANPSRAIFKIFAQGENPDIPVDTVRVLDAEWRDSK